MEDVLLAVVALALGMKTDEVAELAKSDEGKATLTTKYKDKVKEIKTESFNSGATDREGKVRDEMEKDLKDTFGVKSAKKGKDLFAEIKAEAVKPEAITDEAVKASKLFIALEKQLETAKSDAEKDYTEKLKEFESKTKQDQTTAEALADAFAEFDKLKPILSKDATRLANQRNIFAEAVRNGYTFEKLEDKSWLIKKDNKRLEDGAGNRVKFEDFVREKTLENFDIAEAYSRSSTGNDPAGTSDGKTEKVYKGAAPKTEAEFMAIQRNKEIPPAERLAIAKVYNDEQQAANP